MCLAILVVANLCAQEVVPKSAHSQRLDPIRCGTCLDGARYSVPTSSSPAVPASLDGDETIRLDYMVVFDRSAQLYMSDKGGAEVFAAKIVTSANEVFRNSDINAELRLVGIMLLDEEIPSVNQGLDRIHNLASVQMRRAELKADLVTLCSNPFNDGLSGVAAQEAKRMSAYSSIHVTSIFNSLTAVHEIGHIFGCHHSRIQEDAGDHPYAVGVGNPPYYTVMGSAVGDITDLAPIFSSPKSVWRGVQLGSERENSVRKIRERLAEVASFGDYLEPRYYVDHEQMEVTSGAQTISMLVRTSELFEPRADVAWLRVLSPRYSLDDVPLVVAIEANTGTESRTGHIVLEGSRYYKPLTITITQTSAHRTSTDAPNAEPVMYVHAGQVYLSLLDETELSAYTLQGHRVFSRTFASGEHQIPLEPHLPRPLILQAKTERGTTAIKVPN